MLVSVYINKTRGITVFHTSFVERKLMFKIVQFIELVDLTFQMPETFVNA